jgi:hypothetical protein
LICYWQADWEALSYLVGFVEGSASYDVSVKMGQHWLQIVVASVKHSEQLTLHQLQKVGAVVGASCLVECVSL